MLGLHQAKRDVQCADTTGNITMVLWRDQAQDFNFQDNDIVAIDNVLASSFNNQINISSTSETTITKVVDEDLANLQPNMTQKPVVKSIITTTTSNILSIKDFQAKAQCINCHHYNHLSQPEEEIVNCTSCSAQFLKDQANIINECSILLTMENSKQWFTAKTPVSIKINCYNLINFIKSMF